MSRNFLGEILARKHQRVTPLREQLAELRGKAHDVRRNSVPHRLRQALAAQSPEFKIIAEFKRRSPSAGLLRADVSPGEIAASYEKGGACAISVLTEEDYFAGSLADLIAARGSTKLPVLRKDFVIDPAQIFEAAIAGADAVLLIAAALDDESLQEFRRLAEEELQLDALVEVHDLSELERAVRSGATLIGANNRDLNTLEVSVRTSEELIQDAPPHCTLVSESGLRDAETLRDLRERGYDAFLIGETFMRGSDPAASLRNLLDATHTSAASR